jgi:phage terminase small subunit
MPRHSTESGLTAKQERFVAEYLVDGNATRASTAAGYSVRTAQKIGSELLTKPVVKAAIAKALKAQERRTLVTADANLRAIERLAQRAEGDGEWSAAIRARELIGKHYRSFTDKVELTGKDGGPVEFTEVRRTVVDPAAPKP